MRERVKEKYEDYEGDYVTITKDDDDCLRAIRDALGFLSLPERKIFVMYTEAGTYSEVAKELKCSVPTVSNKIKAIQAKLRKKVEVECTDY